MTGNKYTREDCIQMLLSKREGLLAHGIDRHPQRSDFENVEVVAIKAFLGPWPRALEEAGLKEPPGGRLDKDREKRAAPSEGRAADQNRRTHQRRKRDA